MAAVDIDIAQYEKKKKASFSEHVLCTIQYSSTHLLRISPGFSTKMPDDHDTDAKGAPLQSFTFLTQNGASYEYTVQNISESGKGNLANQMTALEIQDDIAAVSQWHHRCGYIVHDEPPPAFDVRCYMNIEIMSANAFDAERVYIHYDVILPDEGWTFENNVSTSKAASMTSGVTQTTSCCQNVQRPTTTSSSEVAPIFYFGFPIELNLLSNKLNDPIWGSKSPILVLQVFARDSWERVCVCGYGSLTLPTNPGFHEVTVRTWSPMGSIRDQMQEFFIGGSNQCLNASDIITPCGVRSSSSGSIRLRVNVLRQEHVPEETQSPLSGKRDVKDILFQLKETRARRQARDHPPPAAPPSAAPTSQVSDMLASIKSKRMARKKMRGDESVL